MGRQRISLCLDQPERRKKILKKDLSLKKYESLLSHEDKLLFVLRRLRDDLTSPKKLIVKEFTVIYQTLFQSNWMTVRKHCFMMHNDEFHTHIRTGLGKHKWKKVPAAIIKSMNEALEWSRKDMIRNWSNYKGDLLKMLGK